MTDERPNGAAHALEMAATAARYAPSVHNTQPWRWVVRPQILELYAERDRQLRAVDPDGHLLLLSCGAALHHARVALDAEGWRHEIERSPAATAESSGDPVARIRATGHVPTDPEAMRHFQATLFRRTDRRAVGDEPVPPAALEALIGALRAQGARLQLLRREQVVELAVTVERAQAAEAGDERQRHELAAWVGGARLDGAGIPDSAIPAEPPEATVAERDFGQPGTLPAGTGHDTAATYAVLWGDGDEPIDWLRAGEGLSAAWLNATEHGLTIMPLSAPIEVAASRQALRRLLGGVGYPYLALRIGVTDPEHSGPPHTPRLPAEQVIEFAD